AWAETLHAGWKVADGNRKSERGRSAETFDQLRERSSEDCRSLAARIQGVVRELRPDDEASLAAARAELTSLAAWVGEAKRRGPRDPLALAREELRSEETRVREQVEAQLRITQRELELVRAELWRAREDSAQEQATHDAYAVRTRVAFEGFRATMLALKTSHAE